jgi:hypothetical protein
MGIRIFSFQNFYVDVDEHGVGVSVNTGKFQKTCYKNGIIIKPKIGAPWEFFLKAFTPPPSGILAKT